MSETSAWIKQEDVPAYIEKGWRVKNLKPREDGKQGVEWPYLSRPIKPEEPKS